MINIFAILSWVLTVMESNKILPPMLNEAQTNIMSTLLQSNYLIICILHRITTSVLFIVNMQSSMSL